ncbi:hypothetical protein Trydic_g11783 [Trypoxylus dichotomus]
MIPSLFTLGKRFFHITQTVKATSVEGPSGWTGKAGHGSYKRFKYIALVNLIVIAALTYKNLVEKVERRERPPFVRYEYMRIRSKRFPWGEGDKSLFHNPHTNAISSGYEEIVDEP